MARWLFPVPSAARARAVARSQRGALLLETLLAITLLTLMGTAVLSGTSTLQQTSVRLDHTATADNLARSQLETILDQPYQVPPQTFTPISAPAGYSISASSAEFVVSDPNLALITVSVSFDGNVVRTIESLMSNEPS